MISMIIISIIADLDIIEMGATYRCVKTRRFHRIVQELEQQLRYLQRT
jgi:hypothetical protein